MRLTCVLTYVARAMRLTCVLRTNAVLLWRAGHKVIVNILLEHGADKSIKNDAGLTPKQLADEAGYDDVVELL